MTGYKQGAGGAAWRRSSTLEGKSPPFSETGSPSVCGTRSGLRESDLVTPAVLVVSHATLGTARALSGLSPPTPSPSVLQIRSPHFGNPARNLGPGWIRQKGSPQGSSVKERCITADGAPTPLSFRLPFPWAWEGTHRPCLASGRKRTSEEGSE